MTDKDKNDFFKKDWDVIADVSQKLSDKPIVKRHEMSDYERIFCAFVDGYANRAGGLGSLTSEEIDALGEVAKKYTLKISGCKPVDFDQFEVTHSLKMHILKLK